MRQYSENRDFFQTESKQPEEVYLEESLRSEKEKPPDETVRRFRIQMEGGVDYLINKSLVYEYLTLLPDLTESLPR